MEIDDCCAGCSKEKDDDLAQEQSTIISNLPDPEQSYDIAPFDYSVDMFLETSCNKIKASVQNQSVLPRPIARRVAMGPNSNHNIYSAGIPDKNQIDNESDDP